MRNVYNFSAGPAVLPEEVLTEAAAELLAPEAELEALAQGLRLALEGDSVSAYGGVIAANRTVTRAMAETVQDIFTEVVVAPGFEPAALEILQAKKNIRLLELPEGFERDVLEYRQVSGGALLQVSDRLDAPGDDPAGWTLAAGAPADEQTLADLAFAWKALRAVKSNAILLADHGDRFVIYARRLFHDTFAAENHGSFGPHYQSELWRTSGRNAIHFLLAGTPLPEVITARLDWSTELDPWPSAGSGAIFKPIGTGRITLAVEVQAPTTAGKQPSALVSCSISPFDLNLIAPVNFIILHFETIEFLLAAGKKPDVNVKFREGNGIEFAGPLTFINTLKDIIPFDGFSDPPYLDVTAEGINAGFDLAIPDLAVGVFALTNIALAMTVEPLIVEVQAQRVLPGDLVPDRVRSLAIGQVLGHLQHRDQRQPAR